MAEENNNSMDLDEIQSSGRFGDIAAKLNNNFRLIIEAILKKRDGKSAYEIWVEQEGNEGKSVDDFWAFLTADKGFTKVVLTGEDALPDASSADAENKIYIFPNSSHTEYYTKVSNGTIWIELLHNNGNINYILDLLGLCLTRKGRDTYLSNTKLDNDGNTLESSLHTIDLYNVTEGDTLALSGKTIGSNIINYAFFNSSELSETTLVSIGSKVNSNTVVTINEKISVPVGASYLAVVRYKNTSFVPSSEQLRLYYFAAIDDLLDDKQTQIDALNAKFDILNDRTMLQQKLSVLSSASRTVINTSGIPTPMEVPVSFDVYPVTEGQSIKLKGKMLGSNIMQYAFYNTASPESSQDVIEIGNIAAYSEVTNVDVNIIVPALATHIGVSRYSDTSNISLNEQIKAYLNVPSNLQELKEDIVELGASVSGKAEQSEVDELDSALSIKEPQELLSTITGEYFKSDDTIGSFNTYSIDVYTVTAGDKITVYGKNLGYKVRDFVFLNSSTPSTEAIVAKSSSVTNDTNNPVTVDATLVVPEGATHIAISYYNMTSKIPVNERIKLYLNVKSNLQELKNEINEIGGGSDKTFSVTKLGSTITVSRKYNDGNIIITLSPSGPNQLVQLSSVQYTGTNAHTIGIGTDWVGPYIVYANDNPLNSITGEFVGGWHSYANTSTGVPTANTNSVKLYCDGELISENGTYQCQTCSIVVDNNIRGTNTKTEVYENGRDILNEKVSYSFKEEDLFVKVVTEALESLRINRYYGMQVSGYSAEITFMSDEKATSVIPDSSAHNMYSDTKMLIAKNTYNDFVVAEMFPIGIGVKNYIGNNSPKALVNGNKGYHCLVYNSDCNLDEGEMVFWNGRYRFVQDIVM